MRQREKTQVLIAGAGPVGTVIALALGRQGVDVVICERTASRAQDLRASTFHPPTLEIFDQLDVIDPLLDYGLKAPVYHFRERRSGETIAFDYGNLADATPYPFRVQCEQHVMAEMLANKLDQLDNVQALFNHSIVAFDQRSDHVEVHVEAPLGILNFEADYLVAADGGNSIIRKWLDVQFEGFTYPEKFLCFSTTVELRDHIPDLALVNYVADSEEWLVLLRAPSAWRVLVPVPEETPDQELLSDRFKEQVFERLIGIPATKTVHRTVYRVHQRVAEKFNFSRVFLAGDAAHLNNPLGGFGMNSGIHDAWNLHQKIAHCLSSSHDPGLFERYERQRKTVTHNFIQAQTIQNKRFLEYNAVDRHEERLREMRETANDPIALREFLMRQSMLQSIADAEAIQ